MATRGQAKNKVQKKVEVPEERLKEYRDAFDLFDKDKSGAISVDEIRKVLKDYGHDYTKGQVQNMIADLDEDESGDLNFDEFVVFINRTTEVLSEEEEVIRAFEAFDRDGNGWLSMAEFKHILTSLGNEMSEKEVEEIFKEADLNQDGRLEYREFVEFWKDK